jgi:hypothetical protein
MVKGDRNRLLRYTALALAFSCATAAAGYVGLRMGRAFERNHLCCELPRRHNFAISLREALGLLEFPSQIGQDRWVAERVFPGLENGYFLDVGSTDGYRDSNTWALEQRGWQGICVDPFPTNMEERRCLMFREAVSSIRGEKVRFAEAGDLGGIVDHLGLWKEKTQRAAVVELTTSTLEDILERAAAPPYIHFMSLDIEGAELEALKGFPFDRYALGSLTVEHNYEEPKRSEIEQFLSSRGYVRVRTWMQDDFYLPRRE